MIHKLIYSPTNKEANNRNISECVFYFQKEPYVFCSCCLQKTTQQKSYEVNSNIYKIIQRVDETGERAYE